MQLKVSQLISSDLESALLINFRNNKVAPYAGHEQNLHCKILSWLDWYASTKRTNYAMLHTIHSHYKTSLIVSVDVIKIKVVMRKWSSFWIELRLVWKFFKIHRLELTLADLFLFLIGCMFCWNTPFKFLFLSEVLLYTRLNFFD